MEEASPLHRPPVRGLRPERAEVMQVAGVKTPPARREGCWALPLCRTGGCCTPTPRGQPPACTPGGPPGVCIFRKPSPCARPPLAWGSQHNRFAAPRRRRWRQGSVSHPPASALESQPRRKSFYRTKQPAYAKQPAAGHPRQAPGLTPSGETPAPGPSVTATRAVRTPGTRPPSCGGDARRAPAMGGREPWQNRDKPPETARDG